MIRSHQLTLIFVLCFSSFSARAQDAPEVPPGTLDGKLMYDAWCARCHGTDGKGPLEGVELDTPVPDFTDCSFTTREPRKDWLAVVMHGGPARGLSMTMPAWGEAITEDQARAIISHVRTFCTEAGWPEGELNFRRPQVTGKAFPENELLLVPALTPGDPAATKTKIVYESRIGSAGQWEIAVPFVTGPAGNGIGDIEIAGKYAFFFDTQMLAIASAGIETVLPSGDVGRNTGGGTVKIAPFIAAAKAAGPTFFQSSVKLEVPLKAGLSKELLYNIAWTIPLTREKQGFYPMIELNGVTELDHSLTTWFITPQIYAAIPRRGHVAVSIGAQIPLGPQKPFDYKIVGFFLWEYADGGIWW